MTLQEFFTEHPKAALGCSGGVDSSYLLWAAVNAGADIAPYYIQTAFQPAFELEDAQRLCAQIGVKLNVIRLDALADPVWRPIRPTAATTARWGYSGRCGPERRPMATTFCWTAPTPATTRATGPGMKALREMEVRSPLRECGLTKAMIRQESRKAGLFTWDKPAYACLATRVPTGRTITPELLRRVEGAETALFALGFTDFRVRLYGEAARLQLPEGQLAKAVEQRQAIRQALAPWFDVVLLDTQTR